MEEVQLGKYRHFKGGEYEVIGTATHSEDLTQEFVVYESLEDSSLWVSPKEMFLEKVVRDGYFGLRFKFISKSAEK